jgi:starch-binding outer membrane protein, SusD/RagB family
MNKRHATAGVALSLALLGVGCDSWLSGPGLNENPNNPLDASAIARFVAVQASTFTRLEGQVARFAGIYTQQLIGSNNQQQLQGTQYGVSELDVSGFMSGFYTGGGLFGLRQVQEMAIEADDAFLEGIAKVWEAYSMGTATSVWGDLPYSEAVTPGITSPKLDTQRDIYLAVLALLDEGIARIQADAATGNCAPADGDLVYCATATARATQKARWIAAANTLKARFQLHLAEREGAARYTAAIAAANLGINEAPTTPFQAMHGQAPGDFRALHGSTANVDANIWQQFLAARQDIVAGHELVALLKARNDPRLTAYFDANQLGHIWGMDADGNVVSTGCATGTAGAACRAAAVVNTSVRRQPTFRQPFITWAENQLILAEAKFATNDSAGGSVHVNNVRTAVGMPALAAPTFQDVMYEKYIAMFQNIDVWSDFRRRCLPLVKPYLANAEVLGRLPYGSAERTSNPNVPLPASYPDKTTGAGRLRNWNDPAACPRP